MSEPTLRMYAVREALRRSGGERTTVGVPFGLTCGACGESKSRDAHDGGVWVPMLGGSRMHTSVCTQCSQLYDPSCAVRAATAAENARCVKVLEDLGYDQLAMRVFEPAAGAKPAVTAVRHEFERVAARNVIVRHFLGLFRAGDIPTFEECLMRLVCALAQQNEQFIAAEVKRLQFAPPPAIIVDGGKDADSYKLNPGGMRS